MCTVLVGRQKNRSMASASFCFPSYSGIIPSSLCHMRQLYPQSMQELGLCGVLVAADSLILMRAFAPEKRPLSMVLIEALGGAVGFAVVLFAVSGIWNILEGVEKATAGAFRHARIAVGLIIVALLAALWQYGTNCRKRKKRREILR